MSQARHAGARTIVLVGAPGSGKSTVGELVAQRLDVALVDVDSVIEQQAGRSIAEIFATDGEAAFRELEVAATLAALQVPGVISLGGGAVLSERIRQQLQHHRVVWLRVSASTAANRVGLNVARPLLLGNVRGRLNELLKQRLPLYQQVATWTVDTDDRSAAEVAEEIAGLVEQNDA